MNAMTTTTPTTSTKVVPSTTAIEDDEEFQSTLRTGRRNALVDHVEEHETKPNVSNTGYIFNSIQFDQFYSVLYNFFLFISEAKKTK